MAPDAQFSTRSWIERIIILGASKPSKVTLKTAGEWNDNIFLVLIPIGWYIFSHRLNAAQ